MGREEQIEEREVLDSIFPDEIYGQSALEPITSLCLPNRFAKNTINGRKQIFQKPNIEFRFY